MRFGQVALGDAGLEAAGVGLLEQQRRDQADEVGVAAALAEAVQRALDLPRAGVDGGERAGHGVAGVVVGVDAEPVAGDAGGDDRGGDLADLGRQRAAVGVAEHHPAGAGVERRLEAGERVVGVGLPAVEEVLGVEQRLAALGLQEADRGGDVVAVLLEADPERGGDVEVVGLADEADRGRAGVDDAGEDLVVRGGAAGALGHAEGGQAGVAQRRDGGEEGAVGGVGARPAAFDVVDAEAVERLADPALVLDGEVDALALLAVAEGGVVEVEALAGHAQRLQLARDRTFELAGPSHVDAPGRSITDHPGCNQARRESRRPSRSPSREPSALCEGRISMTESHRLSDVRPTASIARPLRPRRARFGAERRCQATLEEVANRPDDRRSRSEIACVAVRAIALAVC